MCGITGFINFSDATSDITGDSISDENLTAVLDGKIFNKDSLCKELGITATRDISVLLAAYKKWGAECVNKLNGAFSFAVWDKLKKTLFAARDHLGVKPFFYRATEDQVFFASTLKDLFKNPQCPAVIDKLGINQMFLLGPGRISGSGIFKGIEELCPGEYAFYKRTGIQKTNYYKLKARAHGETLEQTIKHLRTLVVDSINRQLDGEPNPACFLSGGLDSSIITHVAGKKRKNIATFSIDYKDNEKHFVKNAFQTGGDAEYVKLMNQFAQTDHRIITLESDAVFKSLKEAALLRGLPGMGDVDSALLLGCKEVKKTHNIVLSGECADELFGGYPWYFDSRALDGAMFPWSRSLGIRKSLMNKHFLVQEPEKYVSNYVKQTMAETDTLPNEPEQDKNARRLFMLNIMWFMQTLLDRSDRMARACGLEIRVPFCDPEIVEYAFNIPWGMKALHKREKGLLREVFKGILPDEIINRKKNPFPKTYDPQYYELVKKGAIDAVNRGGLLSKLINREYFDTLVKSPPEQIEPWYGQLMRLPQVFAMLIQLDYIFEEFKVKLEG